MKKLTLTPVRLTPIKFFILVVVIPFIIGVILIIMRHNVDTLL